MTNLDKLRDIVSRLSDGPDVFLDSAFPEFFSEDCLLRQSARDAEHPELASFLRSTDWQDAACELNRFLGAVENGSPLTARVFALRATISSAKEAVLRRDVGLAIRNLRNYWAYGQDGEEQQQADPVTGRPTWYFSLKQSYRRLFDILVQPHEWSDMAVNLIGATVASMLGCWQRPAKPTVSTWILFAVQAGGKTTGGVVAKLRLWKATKGNGFFYPDPLSSGYEEEMTVESKHDRRFFYPDPLSSGYVRLDPTFREALGNAWQAIMGELPAKEVFDVCWSVECLFPQRPLSWPPLVGRSGEAAIACALKALRGEEPLDENVAVTAVLEEPTKFTKLDKVQDVLDKMLAEQFLPYLKRKRIFKVVVHTSQPEAKKERLDNDGLEIVGVDDLPQAYDHLSRFAKARRSLRKRIDKLATDELHDECIGAVTGGFVFPRISRRQERPREALLLPGDSPEDAYEPLAKDYRKRLTTGQLWDDPDAPRRIRMLANSGAGKSMLLAYCDQQMARGPDGLVPLRLKRLSEINWQTTDPYGLIAAHLPWDDDLGDEDHKTIVQRLCHERKLVLLLDALDQTTQIPGLGGWLDTSKGKFADCPIIVTGRPFTETLFGHIPWETLRVDPFEREEQEEFLGELLVPKLLMLSREANEDPETIRRKQQWEPLLKIPMLLKLMKQLAQADRLDGLSNCERVYEAAVGLLIDRGRKTLTDTDKVQLTNDDIEKMLPALAWKSIGVENNFAGSADDKIYNGALASFATTHRDREDLKQSLEQINVFARREDGIEWRHRSFLEYFAAIYLCNLKPAEQTREIATVHDCAEIIERLRRQMDDAEAPEGDETRPSDEWEWVYRFALMRAQALGKRDTVEHLARELIAHGNPYVVYDAIRKEGGDEVTLDAPLADLCRWLVHQTWTWNRGDYTDAWDQRDTKDVDAPLVDVPTLQMIESLFDRRWRRSECLPPAWSLVQAGLTSPDETVRTKAQAIRDPFLAEINELHESPVMQQFLASFQNCPPNPDDTLEFKMGASPADKEAEDDESRGTECGLRIASRCPISR